MVGYVSDAEIAAQWAVEKAIGVGAKAAWNATVGPAVNAAIDSAWASVFGGAALEGGGVAAGSGLVGGAAGGAGVTGAIAGAFAAFAPAGIALAVFSLLAAIGSKPNYTRTIDSTSIRWDGERFVAQRDQAVGDDETGKLGDYVADKLNLYYEARGFDPEAYRQNNPYLPASDPENDQVRGGGAREDPSYIGNINRYIPDIRNPTVGYGLDVGWAGDGLALANGAEVGDSAVRRILLRAGESAESIDAFLGGPGKGVAGGLPLPQTFGLDRRGGAEEPVLDREDFKLQTPDNDVRYQVREFVPLDQYMASADGGAPAKTGPKPAYRDPNVPDWLSSWTMGRDRPTTKPAAVDEKLWTAWNAATPEEQANAWRYIGADPWRELTGLPAA